VGLNPKPACISNTQGTAPCKDLVMEIDITSPSLNKLPIYAAVGIAEVWRYTREGLPLYQLLQDGYVP
jgi:Uma2 family endonuclease